MRYSTLVSGAHLAVHLGDPHSSHLDPRGPRHLGRWEHVVVRDQDVALDQEPGAAAAVRQHDAAH